MYNSVETFAFKNVSATPTSFTLRGGRYGVMVSGGTVGTAILQRLAADGATYVNAMSALTAAGYTTADLPSGTYQLSLTGSSGVYADVTSVVTAL